ncbi:hypothetical protein FA95DRAFT_1604922 [Auriscalpium vulgare]|uniref:Uncharacterized protein n=1 Tax=Auriscalpium vulgare TaxID=40419 RepID=A0ACB8RX37_9AGAM|nr:hypothetical protein FA95DRAFT_1604922 [Auriscalpium vulgare]
MHILRQVLCWTRDPATSPGPDLIAFRRRFQDIWTLALPTASPPNRPTATATQPLTHPCGPSQAHRRAARRASPVPTLLPHARRPSAPSLMFRRELNLGLWGAVQKIAYMDDGRTTVYPELTMGMSRIEQVAFRGFVVLPR